MNSRRLKVLCPMENEKSGKTYWMRIGTAFSNADGSTNILLDALPVNRKLHVRDLDERDRAQRRDEPGGAREGDGAPAAADAGLPF